MDMRRFEQLWHRCAGQSIDVSERFAELETRYVEPHRRYHTPEHIEHCLAQFDAGCSAMDNADAVELAVWYHDVVYDIGSADNEARSAQLFARQAQGDLSAELIRTVVDLIMVTMHLEKSPETADQAYLVDIDLSSFGLPWERFLRDSVAVRDEFPNLSDEVFYPQQHIFLGALLKREHFCFTELYRQRHELQARENITLYLQNLVDQGVL
jgi:predicted metal-dependent HD superfamily phosphohydrolase